MESKPNYKEFDNIDRNRYYGLRIGDLVSPKNPHGTEWYKGQAVVVAYTMDNNRVIIRATGCGTEIGWTAEWCEILKKVDHSTEHDMAHHVYEKILRLFTDNGNTMREWSNAPFSIAHRTMATDGHALVYFDKKLSPQKELQPEHSEKVVAIIKPHNCSHIISVHPISEAIEKNRTEDGYDEVGEDVDCPACDGCGAVEWEFEWKGVTHTTDRECPVCEGEGLESSKQHIPNGKKILPEIDGWNTIRIGLSIFGLRQLDRVLETAKLLNTETIELVCQEEKYKCSIFKVGEVEVLVMPFMESDTTEIILNVAL